MKNTVLLLLLLCACSVGLNAQEYFIKPINITETSSDNGVDIVADENGYVVLSASLFNGSTIAGTGIFKTDFDGNKLWENGFNFYPYESGVRNLIQLANNGYLISGARVEEGLSFQDLFTFFTTNGGVYKSLVHGDSMDNRPANSILRGNKIISFTSIKQPNTGLEVYNHTLLITMDSSGVILREDTLQNVLNYPLNGSEEIILLPTNEYVLGIGAQNEANKIYGYIRKTDTIGTTIWERKINDYAAYTGTMHLKTLTNGNIVVTWYERQAGDALTSHFVRCYNAANGDSLWQYTFKSIGYIRNIQDLHVCANGDIIGTGYTTNFDLTGTSTCWLFRLSPQGELRWLREYVYWEAAAKVMLLYALTEDPNGDIVATGFAGVYNEQGNVDGQAVLLKVNSMGCFGAGGCNDTAIVSSTVTGIEASPQPPPKEGGQFPAPFPPPLEGARGRLMVFPNPADNALQVLLPSSSNRQSASLQIIDLQGRVLHSANLPTTVTSPFVSLSTANLPNGMYVLTYTVLGVVQNRAKVVVNHQ